MNEEQLADLLTEHLDALLVSEPLPETVPDEVAELLAVARSLFEAAPTPRPEFGPALKVSLLGPTGGGNGAAPGAGSTFSSSTLFILVIGLLLTVAGLGLIANLTIFVTAKSNLSESLSPTALPSPKQTITAPTATGPVGSPSPIKLPNQTQTVPAPTQSRPSTQTPSALIPTIPAIAPTRSAQPVASPTPTATPIIDVLPAVTFTIEIRIEPPDLVPGPSGGGNSGGSNNGGGGSGGGSGGGGGGGSGGGGGGSSGGGDSDDDGDNDD
jgi:uncharacterized membrane protein YgcG